MSALDGLCAGGIQVRAGAPCPDCGAERNETCGRWVRFADVVIKAVRDYRNHLEESKGANGSCDETHRVMIDAYDNFIKEGCQP